MFVYTDYEEAKKNAPYCIALGSFDGVHFGHKKLIDTVLKKSEEFNCNSMIYTFLEHPKKILSPDYSPEMITDNKRRMYLAEKHGLDNLYFEDFKNIKDMDSNTFIREVLIKIFRIKCAVAGYNFRFGHDRSGDVKMLKTLGEKYGFEICIIEPVEVRGNAVSSSLIRDMIKDGNVEPVKEYLGRHFSINGVVIHGKKNGEKIGVRTANISVNPDIVVPKLGVYHTNTIVDGKVYSSITNIGYNPTFNGNKISIETHIIAFDGYLYNREIEVEFLKWHREEKPFCSIDELKQQINYDINFRLLLNM